MRATIVGTNATFEVIGEEVKIAGTDERFAVHMTRDAHQPDFAVSHLETSQVIGRGITIDEAIADGTRKWLAATPELIAEKLAERLAWASERIKERAAGAPP